MNNRWQANRIGFVNFWLYDEEVFEFDNGKMLLRGENASGKSITTQSIIPFILDGDRSPERLDPFGSRDRKMEYYFLGENESEESTGYIFLEFAKKDSNQYRTIGIGQRARKGKPMTFWGFVLLDNRRIGEDLQLYKQVGDKKIPKTKQELKNDLGEHNRIVESPREYMELVNKYIFEFPRLELYEQFIKLLIKVRAPKLSKDLKPSLVYTILNDSLQTLSDDDLSAMVDAMEQLDTMQATIDDLKETLKNIIIIRNEYDRYNRYMLGTKARNYRDNHKSFIKLRENLEHNIKEKENCLSTIKTVSLRNEQISQEIKVCENEIEMLDLKEVNQQIERRDNLSSDQIGVRKSKQRQSQEQEKAEEDVKDQTRKLQDVKNEMDSISYDMKKNIYELNEMNESVQFDMDISMQRFEEQATFKDTFKLNLKAYEKQIQFGLDALIKHNAIEQQFSMTNEKFSTIANKITELKQDALTSQRMVDQSKDTMIEEYHILNKENKVFVFEPQTFHDILHKLQFYASYEDYKIIFDLCFQTYCGHQKRIQNTLNSYELDRREIEKCLHEAKENLTALKAMKEIAPQRRDKVMKTRAYLDHANMIYQPFYELVEFDERVSEEERNLLEEQLLVSGILDALVIKKVDYEKIKQDWNSFSDVVLIAEQSRDESFTKLKISDPNHALAQEVSSILSCISEDTASHAKIIIRADGYYKNGLLEGHSTADHAYCYIGARVRQEKLKQEIIEQETIVETIEQKLLEQKRLIQVSKDAQSVLEDEYATLPSHTNIDEALALLKDLQVQITREEQYYRELEQEVSELLKEKNEAYQAILQLCSPLPFERKIDVYQEAKDGCGEMLEVFQSVCNAFDTWKIKQDGIVSTQEVIKVHQNRLDELSLSILKLERLLDSNQKEIDSINNFLNSAEKKDVIEKLEKANKALEAFKAEITENNGQVIRCNTQIEGYEAQIENVQATIEQEVEKDALLYVCFQEELNLGYVIKKDGRDTSAYVEEACACLRAQDIERSISDVTTALNKNFQQHASSLTRYGSRLEDLFEDHPQYARRRQVINSTWLGRTVNVEDFYNLVKEEIENNELLLEKKDRELFENILSNTLSQKLSNRIAESRKWIDEMSGLMEQMDTSMGLSFSLKWKPKPPESDQELSVEELNVLLRRDNSLLTKEDIEKVSKHFRSKIKIAKQISEDKGEVFNYQDLIRDALDYRKWFEFHMRFHRTNEEWKELTNSTFNTYSGGEKAMAMYVPLFAAVNAQYKKCEKEDHPRIIALDEAFAGVDDRNIDVMFKLLETIDLDYIMNSQALWGCYPSVSSLHISELLRPVNSQIVTVINYHWNGISREVVDS